MPDHRYTISSPCDPNGSGELKKNIGGGAGRGSGGGGSSCGVRVDVNEELKFL